MRSLEVSTGPSTDQQRQLADIIGLPLTGAEPAGVAAVMLEDHLQAMIWGREPEPATDRQRTFLAELGSDEADSARLTKRVASAWIDHHLAVRTIECHRRLELARGDAVIKRTRLRSAGDERKSEMLDYAVVSSIGATGMVYFRGGNGRCGWPSSLTRAPVDTDQREFPQFLDVDDDGAPSPTP